MLPTTHRRMTTEEYQQLPEGPPYFQLIRGELFVSPSPRFWHQNIVLNIASSIREHLRTHPVGKVVISPSDVELGEADVYQPDIFISTERLENVLTEHGSSGAPDLMVEVLSPSIAKLDRGPKSEVYGATGVKEMWVVDGRNNKIETPLIPGLQLDVREIFEP